MQEKLTTPPVDKFKAQRIAYKFIRENWGSIPSTGIPILNGEVYRVPIEAKYPRVLFDKNTDKPKKVRYMRFLNIGEIKVDINNGEIIEKPRYHEIRNEIKSNLDFIRINVQKALIIAGSEQFAKLPFSEHMHSPIIDIISYLLINDKMEFSPENLTINKTEFERYLKLINFLVDIDLLKIEDDIIVPGNIFIEIESQFDDISDQLAKAMAYYFIKGYNDIPSIHQVLGPHLTIAGFVYQQSIEYDETVPVRYNEISSLIQLIYGKDIMQIKIPRYLIQLEGVGLVINKLQNKEQVWYPNEDIFENIIQQDTMISPIKRMFIDSTAQVI